MIQDHNIPQGYKQTEFGPIPLDWDLCTFKDVLATFSSGATPYRGIPEYYNGDVRWISSGELNYNHIYDTLEHISQQAVRNTNLRIHKPGTFLMAITGLEAEGTRGRCAFVGAPSATNQSCLAINSTDKMCTEYLFWFYRMWGQYLAFKYCQGTKQQSYTADIVKKLPIYGPKDVAEQRAIAEALSDMDGLIAALDKKIAKKRLLKQGAMQQLLTGKKRLPGFTDEWVSVQLKEICSFQNGYTPSKTVRHFWENGTVPWFRMEDIRTNGRILNHAIQHVTNVAVKGDLFPAGSIIMSTTATIGEHALLIVDSLANQQFTNLIIRKSLDKQVDTMWFYHYCYILGEWCRNNINDGGLAAVNMDDFSNVHIALPPILEQQAIATILSDMDKEIADLEAQRDKYRLLKSGMMQKLLTGQIRLKTE